MILSILSFNSFSMSISTLMEINSEAREGKAGVFTLTNTDDITYFLKANVSKIEVKDNQIVKTPYTRENLTSWEIVPKPSKLVVEPKIIKELMIEEVCGERCPSDHDRIYQIDIMPVSYEISGKIDSKVNMLFGFAPYYIIPAKESHLNYQMEYDGEKLRVNNSSNTLINLVIDQCKEKTPEELKQLQEDKNKRCRIDYTVIAGRNRQFDIPAELRKAALDIVVLNHDESIREEKVVRAQ